MRHVLRNTYYVIFLLLLAACAVPDCASEEFFCAALVTDTQGIDDHGMNQDTWAGLEQAKADLLVDQIEFIESVESRDYQKNIAYFAERGFDVIVTVGPGLSDQTLRAADLHPALVFVGMNQPDEEPRPNFVSVTFPEDQMGFLAGALAARISETQIVGAVCETSGIDAMWRYCEGFRAGIIFFNQLTGQNVNPLVVYRNDGDREKLFVDEAWGANAAQLLIQRGTDVIFAAGGATGQGALRAASEAGIRSIGTERNQGAALAESGSGVITSIFGDSSFEVQKTLRMLRAGSVEESQAGSIRYAPLHQTFPENLTVELDFLLLALDNGEVKTNVTLSER